MFLRLLLRRGKSRGLTPTARSPRVPSPPLHLGVCTGAEMKHRPYGARVHARVHPAELGLANCCLCCPITFKPCTNLPFASPSWPSLLRPSHLKRRLPPDPAAGQLKSSIVQGCRSPRGVSGCTGAGVGVLQPRKSSWGFCFRLLCSGCAASPPAKALEGGRDALPARSPTLCEPWDLNFN